MTAPSAYSQGHLEALAELAVLRAAAARSAEEVRSLRRRLADALQPRDQAIPEIAELLPQLLALARAANIKVSS